MSGIQGDESSPRTRRRYYNWLVAVLTWCCSSCCFCTFIKVQEEDFSTHFTGSRRHHKARHQTQTQKHTPQINRDEHTLNNHHGYEYLIIFSTSPWITKWISPYLVLVRYPWPQVAEHFDHSDQTPCLQPTKRQVFSNLLRTISYTFLPSHAFLKLFHACTRSTGAYRHRTHARTHCHTACSFSKMSEKGEKITDIQGRGLKKGKVKNDRNARRWWWCWWRMRVDKVLDAEINKLTAFAFVTSVAVCSTRTEEKKFKRNAHFFQTDLLNHTRMKT